MWAPFMVANGEGGHSSRVNTEYLKWMHGFWKARLEQCYGWMPFRNLDRKALAASVRVLDDALLHEGLLLRAVRQLVLNCEHTGSARQNVRTWCGALLQRIHVVWPQFRIQLLGRLSWTGGPPLGRHREPLANQFLEGLRVHQWQVRQCGVLSARPLRTIFSSIYY